MIETTAAESEQPAYVAPDQVDDEVWSNAEETADIAEHPSEEALEDLPFSSERIPCWATAVEIAMVGGQALASESVPQSVPPPEKPFVTRGYDTMTTYTSAWTNLILTTKRPRPSADVENTNRTDKSRPLAAITLVLSLHAQ